MITEKFIGYYVIAFDINLGKERKWRFPVYHKALNVYIQYCEDIEHFRDIRLCAIIDET